MWSRLASRLTYANIVSSICLFLVLTGGTAVALTGQNTVFSDDITNNEVRTADVRNDNLSGGGLGGRDIRPNAVTGSDILESSLGKVPDADKLDGKDSSAFLSSGDIDSSGLVAINDAAEGDAGSTPTQTLASNATFKVVGQCLDGALSVGFKQAFLEIETNANNSRVGNGSSQTDLDKTLSSGERTGLTSAGGPGSSPKRADFSAVAPNGDTLQGEAVAGVDYAGRDCVFAVDASG